MFDFNHCPDLDLPALSQFENCDKCMHCMCADLCVHQSTLYESLGWSSLCQGRKIYMLQFIAKTLSGNLPTFMSNLLSHRTSNNYSPSPTIQSLLNVSRVHSEHRYNCFLCTLSAE